MVAAKKHSINLLIIVVSIALLFGCESKRVVFDDEQLINQSPLIDKGKFIEQSKTRADDTVKYGPAAEQDRDEELRSAYRTQIDKQITPDYVELTNDGTWKIFPIDVNVENIDIRLFAEMLSKVTGANILVSDEVNGMVTAKLKNVPWPNVLESVLQMKALAKHIDSKAKIIRIHDQSTVVKLEDFKRQRRENLHKSEMLEKAAEPRYTEIFKLFYTKPVTMKSTIEGVFGITTGTGGAGTEDYLKSSPEVTIDNRLNLLIVKARKEDIQLVSKLIKQLDTRTKQVFIEAFIVEISDGFEDAFGARFGVNAEDTFNAGKDVTSRITGLAGTAASAVTAGDSGATLSNLAVGSPFGGIGILTGIGSAADLKVELSAMETDGLSRVISNPRIFTLDNQEATIFQGDEVPFETTSQDGTKVEFKEAGLKLSVLPQVIGDGNLLMNITVNKDTVDTSQDNPPISKSEIKTSLVSRDGAIVVIGGIYDEDKSKNLDKVPGLGDMPVIGNLFKREANTDNRSELMIFIAPRVL